MSETSGQDFNDNPGQTTPDAPENIIQPDTSALIEIDKQGETTAKANNSDNIKTNTEREILDRVKVGERWMILLTAIVAGSAVFQTFQSWSSSVKTTQQTQQLITAAGISAQAARDNVLASRNFAESARGIKQGVDDAVSRLAAQANGIEAARETSQQDSAKALQATISNFQQEQRPWVGIEILPINSPDCANRPPLTYGTTGDFMDRVCVVAKNTGRTPALDLRVLCCQYEETENVEAAPNFDAIEEQERRDLIAHSVERQQMAMKDNPGLAALIKSSLPKELDNLAQFQSYGQKDQKVIPPNGTTSINLLVGSHTMKATYAVGKFIYRDVFDRNLDHVTKFCVVKFSQASLRLCDDGQDMQ